MVHEFMTKTVPVMIMSDYQIEQKLNQEFP